MITENELRIANESYLQQDFYQLYPSILDLVKKITDRWDPSSSNESDPGVVILKLLAFMGDKLDYNTDKNILECFMPSATQEESMRKLCDMMGYEMHYYRSATTSVSFMWVGSKDVLDTTPASGKTVRIPKFANITNTVAEESAVKAVNYILTKQVELSYAGQVESADAIEGQLVDFSINGDDIIRLSNITNNRLYFPEVKIAENGVWIFNLDDDNNIDESIDWIRTTNLNTAITTPDKHYWKFCFDSKRKVPYILFSDDIADIIKNGLRIKYVRTSGVNGNISAKTLDSITTKIYTADHPEGYIVNSGDEQELVIQNVSFTQNGADVETLDDAYTNFKHTIGTFDTLVTCRDYANAIYQMVSSDSDNSNLVSNVQAADVRDDINFVNKIATFNKYGIVYEDVKVPFSSEESGSAAKTISNFDVYIYPLNPIKSLYVARNYDNTFLPNYSNTYDIKTGLEEYKTLSHNICQVDNTFQKDFIYLIKNYYHLKAQIATTYKVSKYESEQIQNNISIALYQNFNARKLEYGEEIPYDSLLSVIQNADPRIKFVSLEEPKITTKIMTSDGNAFKFNPTNTDNTEGPTSRKLIAKNVLAGRVPLFNYDRRFNYSYGESNYSSDRSIYGTEAGSRTYYTTEGQETENCSITAITTSLQIPVVRLTASGGYTLRANESIQLKAPNISTQLTYPISVNYRFTPKTADEYPSVDADYRMQAGDILYIDYTDTNDIEHKIKYWVEGDKPLYTDSATASSEVAWSGIIRANFNLNGKTESEARKSVVFDNLEPINLWTLTNTDQIEIRKPVSVDLKSTLLGYWSTNNANRLIFTPENDEENDESGSEYRYSYTLDSDEYFFYTDNLKNSLVTLGSGTTLTLISTTALSGNELEWKLPNSAQVDIDDIASEGIGAFADTNWVPLKLSENKYLHIEENQLIILGEGTKVQLSSNPDALSEINSDWEKLEHSDSFTYDGKSLTKFENLGSDICWSIRAILNLNFGPNQSMELLEDDDTHPVIQKISFLTSGWTSGGALITDITSDTDLFKYTEEIEEDNPIVEWSSENQHQPGMRIKANFEIQKNGGKDVNVHRYSYSGSLQDDLQIYSFKYIVPETGESGGIAEIPLNTYLDNFTTIDFKASDESGDSQQATLPVYIPEDCFGLMMIYYSGNPEDAEMILNSQDSSGSNVSAIGFYKDCYNSEATMSHTLPLIPNTINIIRIKSGCTLKLSWDNFTSGSVTFSNIDIVHKTSADLSGVNTELLGLAENSGAQFIEELQAIPGSEAFYYNVPIENSTHLDVKTIDEYSWFNYNNICNKFVLAQIDTDLSEIEIVKSSRLGKW